MEKMLIADCNEDFQLALEDALCSRYHVLCCRTGNEALELLRREHPSVLVLDLILPELDGITLLEKSAQEGIYPKVLASTPLITDYVLKAASRLGIGYLMLKPCDVQAMADRVSDLTQPLKKPTKKQDLAGLTTELLLSFHISSKHKGFRCMRDAIQLLDKDPRLPITKVIYPAVAKTLGCKPERVERLIRTALEAAWKQGKPEIWQHYFPGAKTRPSNSAFLARIVEELHLREE